MMLLTAAPFSVQPPNVSFAPRCAARRGDTRGGSWGGCGGQIRRAKQGQQQVWTWGLGAGSGEEIRRGTVESEKEVSELGGDSVGATRRACLLGG